MIEIGSKVETSLNKVGKVLRTAEKDVLVELEVGRDGVIKKVKQWFTMDAVKETGENIVTGDVKFEEADSSIELGVKEESKLE